MANGFLVPPKRDNSTDKSLFACNSIRIKIKFNMRDEISRRTLPILSNSVHKDDVVGLADGDFGGVR